MTRFGSRSSTSCYFIPKQQQKRSWIQKNSVGACPHTPQAGALYYSSPSIATKYSVGRSVRSYVCMRRLAKYTQRQPFKIESASKYTQASKELLYRIWCQYIRLLWRNGLGRKPLTSLPWDRTWGYFDMCFMVSIQRRCWKTRSASPDRSLCI